MVWKKLVLMLLIDCIGVHFLKEIEASCFCNGIPVNQHYGSASGRNEAPYIQPNHEWHKPLQALKVPKPLGDSCWCSKLLVQPASRPQPAAHSKPPHKTCDCPQGHRRPPDSYSASNCPNPCPQETIPADPVSQSLAIRANKAINVPEAKLAFGFVRKPIDSFRKKIVYSDIPEEELFKLNNCVITLKKGPKASSREEVEKDCSEDLYSKEREQEQARARERAYERERERAKERERERARERERQRARERERQRAREREQECERQREQEKKREHHRESYSDYRKKDEPHNSIVIACPTYKMLGFKPEEFTDPEFKTMHPCSSRKHRRPISYQHRDDYNYEREHVDQYNHYK